MSEPSQKLNEALVMKYAHRPSDLPRELSFIISNGGGGIVRWMLSRAEHH